METLGHSQVSLTLNTYSHVLPALQRDAAARMNARAVGACLTLRAPAGHHDPIRCGRRCAAAFTQTTDT
jgi:hypothetical protein